MKPENTTNRPVAELTVSKSSVSIEEGKSTSVSTKIRPNDAANKKLSWKSSNTAIATVSNGTISGKKPGSCQVTVSTTDGCERNQNRIESVAEKCKGSIPMCAYEAMLNWDVRLAMCG